MRSLVVASLAVAIIACLASTVSAGGYGGGVAYRQYQPPQYAYRMYRQRVLLHPGSGGYPGGAGLYGGNYGVGGFSAPFGGVGGFSAPLGGLAGGAIGTGFNLIWLIVILAVLLLLLDK